MSSTKSGYANKKIFFTGIVLKKLFLLRLNKEQFTLPARILSLGLFYYFLSRTMQLRTYFGIIIFFKISFGTPFNL